jgi:uncharacterized protein (DUF4213/DUF364 family)
VSGELGFHNITILAIPWNGSSIHVVFHSQKQNKLQPAMTYIAISGATLVNLNIDTINFNVCDLQSALQYMVRMLAQ